MLRFARNTSAVERFDCIASRNCDSIHGVEVQVACFFLILLSRRPWLNLSLGEEEGGNEAPCERRQQSKMVTGIVMSRALEGTFLASLSLTRINSLLIFASLMWW